MQGKIAPQKMSTNLQPELRSPQVLSELRTWCFLAQLLATLWSPTRQNCWRPFLPELPWTELSWRSLYPMPSTCMYRCARVQLPLSHSEWDRLHWSVSHLCTIGSVFGWMMVDHSSLQWRIVERSQPKWVEGYSWDETGLLFWCRAHWSGYRTLEELWAEMAQILYM